MKKLVFIFAALFVLGITSCDTKPANQGDTQDSTTKVETVTADSNQVVATDATPEAAEAAQKAADDTTASVPQE